MLHAIAQRLDTRPLERHLFFLVLTAITVFFYGSHLGSFDQAIHIPFLKKAVDPTLFPGDPFFDMRQQNFSFFWSFFEAFLRAGILEPVLLIAQIIATYLTLWGGWLLSKTLFNNAASAMVGVLAFLFPHLGISGFPIFEWSLLNRTFVLPFILWAIVLFLRKRYVFAFALLGLFFNLHVISVNFALAMFGLVCLVNFKKIGWRTLLGCALVFLIFAAPVLIWRIKYPPAQIVADPDWLSVIDRGAFYHLFHLIAPFPQILFLSLGGFASFILFWLARRRNPSPQHDRTITLFIVALGLVILFQVVNEAVLSIALINQLQIFRAGVFVIIFTYLYLANDLVVRLERGELKGWDFWLMLAATLWTITPLAPLWAWAVNRFVRRVSFRRFWLASGVLSLLAASVIVSLIMGLWSPGLHIYGRQDAWYDAQIWAKQNTPRDTLFVTPPEIWGFYTPDWRVFSERSTLATWDELLEIAIVPDHFPIWQERFQRVAPGAIQLFRGDYFDNYKIMRLAYYSLTTADFLALGRDYNASYAVLEKPQTRDLPVVYENVQFTIYKIR